MTTSTIDKKIASLSKSESNVKTKLAELSRDLIIYVVLEESHDIGKVNRLLSVLTPSNRETAKLYFKAFLPFGYDDAADEFTTMDKSNKRRAKAMLKCNTWISESEGNDIWVWKKDNQAPAETKAPDYLKRISTQVKKALQDEKHGVSGREILAAVLESGVDPELLGEMMLSMAADREVA